MLRYHLEALKCSGPKYRINLMLTFRRKGEVKSVDRQPKLFTGTDLEGPDPGHDSFDSLRLEWYDTIARREQNMRQLSPVTCQTLSKKTDRHKPPFARRVRNTISPCQQIAGKIV